MRVGDLDLDNWQQKYRTLTEKHQSLLRNFDIDIQYDLKELEEEFLEGVEALRKISFIDSEEYLFQALKEGKKILAESGLAIVPADNLADAAQKITDEVKKLG